VRFIRTLIPLDVMIVVLFSAALHALWNLLVKRCDDKHLAMTAVVLGHVPFALAAMLFSPWPALESLPLLVTGAFLHVGYQLFLLTAYRVGDLSQVYPLARGLAPLIVAFVSVVFLGERLSAFELVAILIIGTGISSLALVRQSDGLRNRRAAMFAAATAAFIAAYSLVDGMGAREAGTAAGFYGGLSLINAVVFAIVMRVSRPGLVAKVISREWPMALFGGGASFAAYAMVTWAFTAAPIPTVAALRETSIVFGLLLGVFVLRERLDLMKVLATASTMLGVGLLRFKR
jgi:drug/metabolite transporter (DMT)-like permease